MKAQNPNARFWVFIHDGWVKLTLRPEQTLRHSFGGPDDEGSSHTLTVWTWENHEVFGPTLTERNEFDGCDCDGRVSRGLTLHANGQELAAVPIEQDLTGYEAAKIDRLYLCIGGLTVRADQDGRPMSRPKWRKARQTQRDYAAEAAGY